MISKNALLRTIDFAILKPEWTDHQILEACTFAVKENVVNVCVHANKVSLIRPITQGTTTLLGTVVGFPTGCHTPYMKGREAEEVVRFGAQEVDMVMNYGALRSQQYDLVLEDIKTVVQASGVDVKVILETAFLTKDEIIRACQISEEAGAAYVKTSTGLAHEGATLDNVRLMKASVSETMKIKAAGGIRDLKTALGFLDAGCARLGTSSLEAILKEWGHQA
jgi:deoxyribose-phosphate aldolase